MTDATGSNHTIHALTELRQRILNGELEGGARLLEVPLATMLKISRTPVREAMWRLAEEGLLERAKSGFMVRAFSHDDVVDAIELRGVLEGTAARLAAERGVEPTALAQFSEIVDRLDACFSDMPAKMDFETYSNLNAQYHQALAELAGSKIIERELERVSRLPFASPSAFLPDKMDNVEGHTSLIIAQAQHREILAAITNREGARAESLSREHARMALKDLETVLKKKRAVDGQAVNLALFVN